MRSLDSTSKELSFVHNAIELKYDIHCSLSLDIQFKKKTASTGQPNC